MRRRLLAFFAALSAVILAGCAKTEIAVEAYAPNGAVGLTAAGAAAELPENAPEGAVTVYVAEGLSVPVPAAYRDLLVVDEEPEAWSAHWQPLISFSERASVEAGQEDHPGENWGDGWLCTVMKLDRIGFEDWASGESADISLFARRGDNYYLMTRPTDVRLYRGGDGYDEASVAQWNMLSDWAATLPEEIIKANGLTACSGKELLSEAYTYEGNHLLLGCRFPGEPMDLVILTLSQPATQGDSGLWCVERVSYVYSEYGWSDDRLVFPASFGIDQTAADYYAKLQSECDAGEHAELLTPRGAALDYARREAWIFGEDVSPTDFEIIEAMG